MKISVGTFKQELIKDYNELNLKMFDTGVMRQKVEFVGDKILISAFHKRIPSLKYLDETNRLITRMTDVAILDSHKKHFRKVLEEKYGMNVIEVLKDYSPYIELAVTVILLDRDVSDYIL